MDDEPRAKRRRTASPPLLQEIDNNIKTQEPPTNKLPQDAGDDKSYQLSLERAFADPRFRSTLAQIFNKYDKKPDPATEAIDPAMCGILVGESVAAGIATDASNLASVQGLTNTPGLSYASRVDSKEPEGPGNVGDCEGNDPNANPGAYMPEFSAPAYMPDCPSGVPPGLPQNWYSNPFSAAAPYTSWHEFPGQFQIPTEIPQDSGPWMTPNGFVYGPSPWAAPPMPTPQDKPDAPHSTAQPTVAQPAIPDSVIDTQLLLQAEESTEQDGQASDSAAIFRRRQMKPRFSKNGKRLGRPPKTEMSAADVVPELFPKDGNESGAYDGEGEDNGVAADSLKPANDVADEDSDSLWGELAEALRQAAHTTSRKRNRSGKNIPPKRETSVTESDGGVDIDTEPDAQKTEDTLRRIQKELIARAVRKSTATLKDPIEEPDQGAEGAEGRRRSGRERKRVDFGEQVSWNKVSAERRASHKITMHLRALTSQARRERQRREKAEAEIAAKEKEKADKLAKEKREAEELAAAKEKEAAAAAAPADTKDGEDGDMPSTIPDSQDTVTTLPIRTTPQKPQAKPIMRQTIRNHVNSVVHFEEDDAASDDEVLTNAPLKKPIFSYPKKPAKPVHNFLGENYLDTVYALSDDEAPTLLDSLKRVSLKDKKKDSRKPIARPRPRPERTGAEPQQDVASAIPDEPLQTRQPSAEAASAEAPQPSDVLEELTMDVTGPAAETSAPLPPPSKVIDMESDRAGMPPAPNGADGDDSGIDIASEQAEQTAISHRQTEIARPRSPVVLEPIFQDVDLLGADDLLDSLDVMSEGDDPYLSPVETEAQGKDSAPARAVDKPSERQSTAEGDAHYSSTLFQDDMEDEPSGQDMPNAYLMPESTPENDSRQDIALDAEVAEQILPEPPSFSFVEEKPEDMDMDNSSSPVKPTKAPSPRHPLPSKAKPKPKTSRLPAAAKPAPTKAPSPGIAQDRPRSTSLSSSRSSTPIDRSSNGKKRSSASRRSLLSLVGGEEDIESLINRKATKQTPKPVEEATTSAPATAPKSRASGSTSSTKGSSSSRRKSKSSSASASSLPRLSLGSFTSSLPRDAGKSSKDRKDAKERRRRSAQAAPEAKAEAVPEKRGACGVDGYTCGRDFCFTCL